MTISQARVEFGKRYDLWAIHAAEAEVAAALPRLGVFKGGLTLKFAQFLRQLTTTSEQMDFIRLKRKDVYIRENGGQGEPPTKQEKQFLNRFRWYHLEQRGLELEIPARRGAGEKIKFASRKTMQKAVVDKFVAAFGDRGVEVYLNSHYGVGFEMPCAGWIVVTVFSFGPSAGEMDYRHLIAGETSPAKSDGTFAFPTHVLATMFWANVCPIRWEYLFDEDVAPACDSAIEFCRELFDVLPKLLSGIERDKVVND